MTADVKIIKNSQRKIAYEDVFIDPMASVDPSASIGSGSSVGPFAVIGEDVVLGLECQVHAHGVIMGPTVMGKGNEIYPFACLGGSPQDLRHKGEHTTLEIGNNNVFREHVTVSRGTHHGGGKTVIGDSNLFMAYCHVAHDCIVGNNVVMANHVTLAGHVAVQDHAVFGGMAAIGTFLRIGESAMVAAGSMVEKEVVPYCMVGGDRARLLAVNKVGLKRRDIGLASLKQIKEICCMLKKRGVSINSIIEDISNRKELVEEALSMLAFLKTLKRGLTR